MARVDMGAQRRPGNKAARFAWLKPGVLLGGLVPLVDMSVRAATGALGANPVSEALNRLGMLALIFLLASLACTPLKLVFEWTWPPRLRRMLGLFAFFYASLHFLVYVGLERLGAQATLLEDLAERPFISVGFLAFLLLVPLALTSTKGMIKRLGAARWRKLHRLAYVAATLGILHFTWRVKRDITEPMAYAAVLALLLGIRVRRAAKVPSQDA
jgi:methionine sulfoxide reductase heme-binding subunit